MEEGNPLNGVVTHMFIIFQLYPILKRFPSKDNKPNCGNKRTSQHKTAQCKMMEEIYVLLTWGSKSALVTCTQETATRLYSCCLKRHSATFESLSTRQKCHA